jgi:NADPH:quinone reductase-like Zn-dependent oxidoreductase
MTAAAASRQLETNLIVPSKACRIHRFGGPEVITLEDMVPAAPGRGEVLVRVKAAGVGPWDAWIRAGKSALPQPLPLTLGSEGR